MPDYPATGKRTLQDNGSWLRTLQRDNVELVRTPIRKITARGVVTDDGVTHDADVIVYATGFRHTDVLWPLKVTGRNGIDLHEMWGSRPYAYLGITVPEFPNFFIVYGPGTHLAHGGSLIFQSELQMRYIDQCLERLAEADVHSMEPTRRSGHRLASTDADRRSRRWCGRIPRSSTRTSRTPTGRSTPSARGASTSIGPRYVSPIGHNFLCDKESEHVTMRTVVVDGPAQHPGRHPPRSSASRPRRGDRRSHRRRHLRIRPALLRGRLSARRADDARPRSGRHRRRNRAATCAPSRSATRSWCRR